MKRSRMHRALLFFLFLFSVQQIWAQTRTVTGTVQDDRNNPVPGASVSIAGSSQGTAADSLGQFSLAVPASAKTLVISYVGYNRQEVAIGGRTSLTITLVSSSQNLNDVVVIGYGTARRREVTGSVATVTAKDFQQGTITTPEQLIAGKVAGVSITSNGGAPGAGSTIRIRGGASLNASNDPLIVVDGVPLTNSNIYGASNPLSLINPNDIASFTILKMRRLRLFTVRAHQTGLS